MCHWHCNTFIAQRSAQIKDEFVCYVVCPSCHSIYEYEDSIIYKANGLGNVVM